MVHLSGEAPRRHWTVREGGKRMGSVGGWWKDSRIDVKLNMKGVHKQHYFRAPQVEDRRLHGVSH